MHTKDVPDPTPSMRPSLTRVRQKETWLSVGHILRVAMELVQWIYLQLIILISGIMEKLISKCCFSVDQKKSKEKLPSLPVEPNCGYSVTRVSRNVEHIIVDKPCLGPKNHRRLVMLYVWLTAKPRHIAKFVKMLTALGVDVLIVRSFPSDFFKPPTGSQAVGQLVVDFLNEHEQKYENVFVFGFSIGAYVFCEFVIKLRQDVELYRKLSKKFVGQIWDSPVDMEGSCSGIAHSITHRPYLQSIIASTAEWLMKVKHSTVTCHFEAASRVMHGVPIEVPAIYVYSDNDPMSPVDINYNIALEWKTKGITPTIFTFKHENTGHCMNYTTYPVEYKKIIFTFMEEVGVADKKTIENALEEINQTDGSFTNRAYTESSNPDCVKRVPV